MKVFVVTAVQRSPAKYGTGKWETETRVFTEREKADEWFHRKGWVVDEYLAFNTVEF